MRIEQAGDDWGALDEHIIIWYIYIILYECSHIPTQAANVWGALDEHKIELTVTCAPAAHLHTCTY